MPGHEEHHRGVIAHFNRRSEHWAALYRRASFRDRLTLFVDRLRQVAAPGSTVLDYGCGAGDLALAAADVGYRVTAVDAAAAMLRVARNRPVRPGGATPRFGEPASLGNAAEFQAIVCSSVLEYVEDDDALLRKLAGLLAPGGHLLISVPQAWSLPGRARAWWLTRGSARGRDGRGPPDVAYSRHRYAAGPFGDKLRAAGLEPGGRTYFDAQQLGALGVPLSRCALVGNLMLVVARKAPDGIDRGAAAQAGGNRRGRTSATAG